MDDATSPAAGEQKVCDSCGTDESERCTDRACGCVGYYLAPRDLGFFARMHDAMLRRHRFPDDPEWTGVNS
jgi:hypothetical protein